MNEIELNNLSKGELLEECEKLKLEKYKSKNKKELIELIKIELENNNAINEVIIPSNRRYEKEEPYLDSFLKTIRNKNGTYKRLCISPLRYAGGKSKAIGFILQNLPKLKEKKIVSPFFGGGSVELCFSQMLGINVIGYDIFSMFHFYS